MNYVDVDPTCTRRELRRRNLAHVAMVWGGTVLLIALVFWVFFGVVLGPYW